jgi:nucleoid-associated protein YgaU
MRKDVKIGMLIGSLLAIAAIVWLSSRPGLTNPELSTAPQSLPEEKPTDVEKIPPVPTAGTNSQRPHVSNETLVNVIEPVVTWHEETEMAESHKIHTVVSGETLSGISQKYYGTAGGWQKIYVANRELLSSPDKLRPGMKLIIPE